MGEFGAELIDAVFDAIRPKLGIRVGVSIHEEEEAQAPSPAPPPHAPPPPPPPPPPLASACDAAAPFFRRCSASYDPTIRHPATSSSVPATAGNAVIAKSGVPAYGMETGATAVPSAAPISGARQRVVVRPFVTRGPPMSREKAAVKGAMNRICALSPSTSPTTKRVSSRGGMEKRSVEET